MNSHVEAGGLGKNPMSRIQSAIHLQVEVLARDHSLIQMEKSRRPFGPMKMSRQKGGGGEGGFELFAFAKMPQQMEVVNEDVGIHVT